MKESYIFEKWIAKIRYYIFENLYLTLDVFIDIDWDTLDTRPLK
jgi:hypothetical protein